MAPIRIAYVEEWDRDFIRWTTNLLRAFIEAGRVVLVRQSERPDLLFVSIWRSHSWPQNLPVVLISNESWKLFPPHAPLERYKAVLGIYPPDEPCNFIAYPYVAAHFDVSIDTLYRVREASFQQPQTRFCCFVTSNAVGELAAARIALFEKINRWRRVDSGGSVFNNLGYRAPRGPDFLRWIAQYKYMICLENTKEAGYITEKPFQAWFTATVPIYDGGCIDPLNRDALIDASGDVVREIERLEADPDLYEAKRRAVLSDAPIALNAFEEAFRTRVLDAL